MKANYIGDVKLEGTSIFEVNRVYGGSGTAFHWAAYYGNTTCVKAIGEEAKRQDKLNSLINKRDNEGRTPIYEASFNGHVEVVKYLIRNKATIDAATNENDDPPGATALIVACQEGQLQVVQLLLNAGADVRRQKKDGADCVSSAAKNNRVEILKEILPKHLSLIKRRLYQGNSILHIASFHGQLEAVNYILPKFYLNCRYLLG